MSDIRIADYIHHIHQLSIRDIEPVTLQCIQTRNNGNYLCSFCFQEISKKSNWHYIIELTRVSPRKFNLNYIVYSSSGFMLDENSSRGRDRRSVCLPCSLKSKSYIDEKEYSTWHIRVSDVVQLFDQEKDSMCLPVFDLWHIVMQYTNPRYALIEKSNKCCASFC